MIASSEDPAESQVSLSPEHSPGIANKQNRSVEDELTKIGILRLLAVLPYRRAEPVGRYHNIKGPLQDIVMPTFDAMETA
mmetsp:Transcript_47045/g.87966  ORF Transcript_47045/g.87966 Transcript_47045/m.87966 type:complete len:80 (+) Transcript_47045:205-444(+)